MIDRHMEFSLTGQLEFIAAWIFGTYLIAVFYAYPYVYVYGVKRTGKTKLLHIVKLTAFNAKKSSSISTPSIFRLIHETISTLCFDEEEKLARGERASEWRAVILSGYKRGDMVFRVEGEKTFRVLGFETYSAKIFANIAGIEDVVADRTIPFIMQRAVGPKGDVEVHPDDPEWRRVRTLPALTALAHHSEVKEIYEKIHDGRVGGIRGI